MAVWLHKITPIPIVPMLEMTLSSRCSNKNGSEGTKVCDMQLFCDARSNTLQQVPIVTACSYNMFTASCTRTFSFLFTSVDYLLCSHEPHLLKDRYWDTYSGVIVTIVSVMYSEFLHLYMLLFYVC